jgi:hypothetical protein
VYYYNIIVKISRMQISVISWSLKDKLFPISNRFPVQSIECRFQLLRLVLMSSHHADFQIKLTEFYFIRNIRMFSVCQFSQIYYFSIIYTPMRFITRMLHAIYQNRFDVDRMQISVLKSVTSASRKYKLKLKDQ